MKLARRLVWEVVASRCIAEVTCVFRWRMVPLSGSHSGVRRFF
jgi:hypothetical protein